ncbi:hypothetical protein Patl1_10632 [Pistacia atlantica]|uniref:Uncharacterized protein n=1 Tax=Pistacia atlantica TaxID=434234 RepID=A0ACC1A206_9ROSI|nr:hypothetical protein Patl1_10632 [Pistacia atlantica]
MDPMNGLGGSELFQAQSHLYKCLFNYISSMSLKCAVELGIPDIVHKHAQPITLPELVSAPQISPTKTSYVNRLMRMLLLKDESNCLTPFVLSITTPVLLTPWHFLGNWFGGNELNAFEREYGMNFWDYGEQNPEFSKHFGQAMASDSQMANLAIKDCKPIFEGLDSLVDWMFHAFGDEDCVKVLKKCREAMATKEGKGEKWERLFLEAGFSHYKITPMFGLRSLIEVYP